MTHDAVCAGVMVELVRVLRGLGVLHLKQLHVGNEIRRALLVDESESRLRLCLDRDRQHGLVCHALLGLIVVQTIDVPQGLTPMSAGRYIGGYELPLKSVIPGDYTLYVTIQDGGRHEVRRADFRVVEPSIQ